MQTGSHNALNTGNDLTPKNKTGGLLRITDGTALLQDTWRAAVCHAPARREPPVPARRRGPHGTVLVLNGNKPLKLRIHRRRAVLYATESAFLDAVPADERACLARRSRRRHGCRPLPLEP